MDKIDSQIFFSAEGKEMSRAERPLIYTGIRVDKYATARASRRVMGAEAYRKAIHELNVQERRAAVQRTRREEAAATREAARAAEEARAERERDAARERRLEEIRIARNARRREARAEARLRGNVVIDAIRDGGWGSEDRDELVASWRTGPLQRLVGQRKVYMQIAVDGVIVKQTEELRDVRGNDVDGIYWEVINPFITEYTDGTEVNRLSHYGYENDYDRIPETTRVRFIVLISDVVPSTKIQQRYLDGEKHCVLEPLAMLWKAMSDNSESPASGKRCGQIARRLEGLKKTYPDGVPEGLDMEAVARVAHRCLVLHDILGNEIKRYNDRSNKYFYFTNTRMNHLEQGRLTLDKTYERVTSAEIMKILREHDKDNVFYLFSGNAVTGICETLRSVRGCWAVFNEDYDLFQAFNASTGVDNYGIDAVRYASLNEFLMEGRVINSAPTPLCDNPNDLDGVCQIDIKKAYTQHRFAPIYRGFLGHITDFVVLPRMADTAGFLANHVGMFRFAVLNGPCELLSTLGVEKGCMYTLPSPEIEYFMSMGLTVRLVAGCWGSTFDIEYTDEMLEKRRYCTWAGKLGMDKADNSYTFKGDMAWASCLRDMLGDDKVAYFSDLNMISVRIPKKAYKTRHHILAFITSYTRMNLLDTMRKVNGSLVKVVLDGLYYRGELPDIALPIHKNKKNIIHVGFREHWYYPARSSVSDWEAFDESLDVPAGYVRNVCVLTGAGGTGKSHSVLVRKSIPRVLYVVPTNVLGRKMRAKWGCDYTSIHKLIGVDNGDYKCRPFFEDHYEPAVVFIDELTMIEKGWVVKALEMYPRTKFYIAGDIDQDRWYQCRNGHPGKFSEVWLPTSIITGAFVHRQPMNDPAFEYNTRTPGETCGYCLECKDSFCWDTFVWDYDATQLCTKCYTPETKHRMDLKYLGTNPVVHPEQPRSGGVEVINKYYYCKPYTTDYRAKDAKLRAFKESIRVAMRTMFTDGGQIDANRISAFVRKHFPITPFDEAVKMFETGDIWIAGTHKTNEKLLKSGVVSGYINSHKEIVDEPDEKSQKRGSFTTHSFQGLTLETERVFVSLDFFEYAMLYTSISRVCNMSQLVIVG